MRVKVANHVYQMSRNRFLQLLSVASEQVPCGVYAVEKNGYAELMNQHCGNRRQLKEARQGLKNQGFRVYSNG